MIIAAVIVIIAATYQYTAPIHTTVAVSAAIADASVFIAAADVTFHAAYVVTAAVSFVMSIE